LEIRKGNESRDRETENTFEREITIGSEGKPVKSKEEKKL